jgi:trans-2,3-dihydro-3-hydroxyanthranilate isomerase
MPARRYTLLDVFTSTRLQGNPLAVVHDADDLPDPMMHAFARETRLSETSFVQSPTVDGADYRNRIWTVAAEAPFAGHPSLGVAAAVALARGDDGATYTQQTHAGLQPIEVEAAGDGVFRASMLQEPAEFGPEVDPSDVLGAVGLTEDDRDPELPCQAVSTGAYQLLAPVREAGLLAGLWPDYDRIAGLLAPYPGGLVLYVVAVDREAGTARARSFGAWTGMGEDPATGSAAGPLCAYLAERAGMPAVTVTQGVEMGRASRLVCAVEGDRVRVGGDAVVVADGTVLLDA